MAEQELGFLSQIWALRGEVAGEMPTSGMAATVDPRMQYLAAIERQGAQRGTGGAPLARAQSL